MKRAMMALAVFLAAAGCGGDDEPETAYAACRRVFLALCERQSECRTGTAAPRDTCSAAIAGACDKATAVVQPKLDQCVAATPGAACADIAGCFVTAPGAPCRPPAVCMGTVTFAP